MALVCAILAVVCFLVEFILSLVAGHIPFDIVVLGFVFLGLWAVFSTPWVGPRVR